MRLRDQYDWVTLGWHPHALLSAIYAARLGLSVLILPLGSLRERLEDHDGLLGVRILDPESSLVTEMHGALSGIFALCGIPMASHEGDPQWSNILSSFDMRQARESEYHVPYPGGMHAYRAMLLEQARSIGVHVPRDVECFRIFTQRRRFVGVQTTGSGHVIEVSAGILGAAHSEYYARLSKKPCKSLLPAGWVMSLAVQVDRRGLPDLLPSTTIIDGDPQLTCEIRSPEEYDIISARSALVHLRVLMPWTEISIDTQFQRLVAERMLGRFSTIAPSIVAHVEDLYPRFVTASHLSARLLDRLHPSEEFHKIYGFRSLDLVPENMRVYTKGYTPTSLGLDNFFIASHEVLPEYGQMGALLGAVRAFDYLRSLCAS